MLARLMMQALPEPLLRILPAAKLRWEAALVRHGSSPSRISTVKGAVGWLRGTGGRWSYRGVRLWGLRRLSCTSWLEVDGIPVARVLLTKPSHKRSRLVGCDRWQFRFEHAAAKVSSCVRNASHQTVLSQRQLFHQVLNGEDFDDVVQKEIPCRRPMQQRDDFSVVGDADDHTSNCAVARGDDGVVADTGPVSAM